MLLKSVRSKAETRSARGGHSIRARTRAGTLNQLCEWNFRAGERGNVFKS